MTLSINEFVFRFNRRKSASSGSSTLLFQFATHCVMNSAGRTAADYFIDLVFYNCILKCYVLIDLKMGRVTHKDVGQMDMYRRMFDDLFCQPDDKPTIGIVLCDETDADIAKYSVLAGNDKLYAVKFSTVIPPVEALRQEIAAQKELFSLQMKELKTEKKRNRSAPPEAHASAKAWKLGLLSSVS